MKKFVTFAVFCMVMSLAVVSCSKDDGGDPDDPAIENPSNPGNGDDSDDTESGAVNIEAVAKLSDFGGVRLIGIAGDDSSYSFEYNNEGALIGIKEKNSQLKIDYPQGIITEWGDSFSRLHAFKLDKKGRFASLSWKDQDEYEYEYNNTFKFNDAGHLVQLTCHDEYGENSSMDAIVIYTWEGDLLVKSVGTFKEKSGSNVTTDVYTRSYYYEGAPENKYMQYSYCLSNEMCMEHPWYLFNVGLLGKGPAKYPTKIMTEWGQKEISYTLNSRGLVEREVMHSNSESYSRSWSFTYGDAK